MTFQNQLTRETELAVQIEATYGASPGALAGTNFFKHHVLGFPKRTFEAFWRNNEANNAQGDVAQVQVGRQSASLGFECDLIPNGGNVPTAPDVSPFLESAFGAKHVGAAHTTTGVGSAGTDIVLTGGGVAASGVAVGDLIAVNQDSAGTYEVRQVVTTGVGGVDHIAVDRAFTTANVASGQAVKLGATYTLTFANLVSLFLWYFNYNNIRYQIPGCVVSDFSMAVKGADKVPLATQKFSLMGQRHIPQSSTSRPTPSTNGQQLVVIPAKLWLGATKYSFVDLELNLKNSLELRNNQSGQLYSDGPKRTGGDKSYWDTELSITPLATDVWQSIFDAAPSYTGQDVIVQFGNTPGQIVAFRCPSWRPQGDHSDVGGEVGYAFKGRCLSSGAFGSVTLAYL